MNKLDITKMAVNFVVGSGVSSIVHAAVANNIKPETTIQKVAVTSGAIVIGMMAKDAAKSYTNAKIDEIAKSISELKANIKEGRKEQQ